MLSFRQSLSRAGEAARANLVPGLILQVFLAAFLVLYLTHGGTRELLGGVARAKEQSGYVFAFLSYVFAGSVLPEILRVFVFQKARLQRENLHRIATSAPLWGVVGVLVDGLYRLQGVLFGTGNDWATLLKKLLLDQFVFSPFLCNSLIIAYFLALEHRFQPAVLGLIFNRSFYLERLFPVQVAAWCIWIPGVLLVYFMPSLLQLPVAVLIQAFWVLVYTTISARKPAAG